MHVDGPAGRRFRCAGVLGELDQLRLQVEVMAVRVDQNLERMRDGPAHDGDTAPLDKWSAADDEIDAMNVSLTKRCYDLLGGATGGVGPPAHRVGAAGAR